MSLKIVILLLVTCFMSEIAHDLVLLTHNADTLFIADLDDQKESSENKENKENKNSENDAKEKVSLLLSRHELQLVNATLKHQIFQSLHNSFVSNIQTPPPELV